MKNWLFILGVTLSLGLGIGIGWYLPHPKPTFSQPLRLKTQYSLINPLLACTNSPEISNSPYIELQDRLEQFTTELINKKTLLKVGIFFRDLNSSTNVSINPEEKFYPASLEKIPIMISAYKASEADPNFLTQVIETPEFEDKNQDQEIPPQGYIQPHQKYPLQEIVNTMIIYSDNNSVSLLNNILDPNLQSQTRSDLNAPTYGKNSGKYDYLTAEQFSYYLRVLYNATYINRANSQAALELLSQTKYTQGLRSPIPSQITVAHKFGQMAVNDRGHQYKELHDCGIIYYPNHPYLLCVMTKSDKAISTIEPAIQEISQAVYNFVSQYNP